MVVTAKLMQQRCPLRVLLHFYERLNTMKRSVISVLHSYYAVTCVLLHISRVLNCNAHSDIVSGLMHIY